MAENNTILDNPTSFFYLHIAENGERMIASVKEVLDPVPEEWQAITREQQKDLRIKMLYPDVRSKVLGLAAKHFAIEDILDNTEREEVQKAFNEREEKMKDWIPATQVKSAILGDGAAKIETLQKANKVNSILMKAIKELSDSEAIDIKELYPEWNKESTYEVQDRILYEGELYRCITPHTAQENWTPINAPSLWSKVLVVSGEIRQWEQPNSTNPYAKGDKVLYNGKIYESEIDGNVWEPTVYGWKETNE